MKQYIILNTSRKHVNYEEDKNKVPMNKPYNIQNTNICNILVFSIFHFLKHYKWGRNDPGRNGIGVKRPRANRNRGETTQGGERDPVPFKIAPSVSAMCTFYQYLSTRNLLVVTTIQLTLFYLHDDVHYWHGIYTYICM